jgi:hypothetical protein
MAGDIKRLEAERADIDARLAAIEEGDNVITLHPAALDRYRADLDRLAAFAASPRSGDRERIGRFDSHADFGDHHSRAGQQRKAGNRATRPTR